MSDEGMKYRFVKRRLYDNYVDRTQKKFDALFHRLAVLENRLVDHEGYIQMLEAETESLRLDRTSVRIAGRRDATP